MSSKRLMLIGGVAAVLIVAAIVTVSIVLTNKNSENLEDLPIEERVQKILELSPIIDGHNDFPWNLRNIVYNDLRKVNFSADLTQDPVWGKNPSSHTDIPRLRKGGVGAQFWVAFTSCQSQYKDAVEQTFEQIDVIKRLVKQYPNDLHFATSTNDIKIALEQKKIASLIAVEGGHSMQFSLGILRMLYEMGARYMTLTHSCNTPWADASPVDDANATISPDSEGLSEFGLKVITEMNRLGMMVDLSHVSELTMKKALNHSQAPVIFSHSSAKHICDHHRNVPDDVLRLVKETNSIVMVNFYSEFIQCDTGLNATLQDVVEHIDYIRNITGPDHIGVGGDYDGVDKTPIGLEDTSKYPDLLAALLETGRWSDEDLRKLARENLLRVFGDVEKVRDSLKSMEPIQDGVGKAELDRVNKSCITAKFESLTEETRVKREIFGETDQDDEL